MKQTFEEVEQPAQILPALNLVKSQEQALPQQHHRRIVSKRAYAKRQVMRMWIGFIAVSVLLGALIPAVYLAYCFFRMGMSPENTKYLLLSLAMLLPIVGIGSRQAIMGLRAAKQIDPGVPLTRANTADLPAPDTLVRASEEPRQDEQSVLLRAATATAERHEEQLVRASAGGTE
jgi:hypothetical protein